MNNNYSNAKAQEPFPEPLNQSEDLHCDKYLNDIRSQMLKFASMQLSDTSRAEDAVQEALESAIKSQAKFNGQASLKTWVFGILKNKIANILRKEMHLIEPNELLQADEEDASERLFTPKGSWAAGENPQKWRNPIKSVEEDQFWEVFEICLNDIPEKHSRVFMMREFLGLESQEICEITKVSQTNLHVLLYRARLRLRECLEKRWFTTSSAT